MARSRQGERGQQPASRQTWKLPDAKARFSELIRLARSEGPQTVRVRGKNAVVVISVEEWEQLQPVHGDREPLVCFLEGLHLNGLDVAREPDSGSRGFDL